MEHLGHHMSFRWYLLLLTRNVGAPAFVSYLCIFIAYKYTRLGAIPLILATVAGFGGLIVILIFAVPAGDTGDSGVGYTAMVINCILALTPMQKIVRREFKV